ncbi:MAG: serine/threonine protein kinase [Deltaproteobacteria bacterium]|nr:serine/threonine protein kinase [Deltaproteobacteria bacterium]
MNRGASSVSLSGMTKVYCPQCGVFGVIRRRLTDDEPCWECQSNLKKLKRNSPTVLGGIPAVLASLLTLRAVLFLMFYLVLGMLPLLPAQIISVLLLVVGAHKFCLSSMRISEGNIDFPSISFGDLQDLSTLFAMGMYSIGMVGVPLVLGLTSLLAAVLPEQLNMPLSGSSALVGVISIGIFLWSPIGLLTYIRTQNPLSMINPLAGLRTISADPIFIWFYWVSMLGVNIFLVVATFFSNAILVIGLFFGAAKAGVLLFTFGMAGVYIRQNARRFDLPVDDDDWENTRPMVEVDLGKVRASRRRHESIAVDDNEQNSDKENDEYFLPKAWMSPAVDPVHASTPSNLELENTGEKWWEVDAQAEAKQQEFNGSAAFDEAALPKDAPLSRAKAGGDEQWLSANEEELMEMYYGKGSQNWLKELKEEIIEAPFDEEEPDVLNNSASTPQSHKANRTQYSNLEQQLLGEKKNSIDFPAELALPELASPSDTVDEKQNEASFEEPTLEKPIGPDGLGKGANTNQLGRYLLEKHVATGGMAQVFLATQIGAGQFRKKVIVKRMLKELEKNEEAVDMFLDEASLASHISHPNVVQILDFGKEAGHYFMALEHLVGIDVERLLKNHEQALPLDVAVSLVCQSCEGLHAAHNARNEDDKLLSIVHRDVSPSNLFLTKNGVVKVLDFGIAQAVDRRSKTKAGIVRGKPLYMAPEQVTGQKVDARADVFALATTLFELLAGTNPFVRDSEYETLFSIATENAPLISTLRDDIPEGIVQALARALQRAPAKRFSSAEEFRQALLPHLPREGAKERLLQFYDVQEKERLPAA